MKKQAPPEESGEKAPLWIISFADMISLLMAFFVMLQTMAAENSNEFLTTGREKIRATAFEFRRNIEGFGMPSMFGKVSNNLNMQSYQNKFKLASTDTKVTAPAKDGEEERLRRLFSKLSELSKTQISQLQDKELVFEAAPIRFQADSLELDEAAKTFLTQLTTLSGQTGQFENATICIVGLAADLSTPKEQWVTSEQRARAVASFLLTKLPENVRKNVYWWGAGANSMKTDARNQSQILIAVDSSVSFR